MKTEDIQRLRERAERIHQACQGLGPKQAVGEMLSAFLAMPEWAQVDAPADTMSMMWQARAIQAEAMINKFMTVARPVELSGKLMHACSVCYGSGVTLTGKLCTCRPSAQ